MNSYTKVGQSRLTPNATAATNVALSRARPGIVIFLHGVNDPGASYESVEMGLCQGLNERLDRADLRAGVYGSEYQAADDKDPKQRSMDEKQYIDDPDTYLYRREDASAKSILIPFYWGYRAAYGEVKRDAKGDPTKLRTQYQDTFGNRLDRNFGKPGGFFANATNNIPEMYGKGFDKWVRHLAKPFLSNAQYMGKAPHRRYFVLAAERLATLIATIRSLYPADTITVIGHSQGTLITLLAQALLVDRNQRCADCVIMVASPYSILPDYTPKEADTLGTLIDIVGKVTESPYDRPSLADIQVGGEFSYGRTGRAWLGVNGERIGKDGKTLVFAERDNRGKVYLYFSHDDSTVGISDVSGIGTLGVPDVVGPHVHFLEPAMDALKGKRFYQRLWSKRVRDKQALQVGDAPGNVALRVWNERGGAGHISVASMKQATMERGEQRFINGEQLFPSHTPMMFGGEARQGSARKAGLDRPDHVTRDVALGNPDASFKWVDIRLSETRVTAADELAAYNAGKEPGDQTSSIRIVEDTGGIDSMYSGYWVRREETPNEIRERMGRDADEWDPNSYHSAILRHPENHRWVTAMDVAIGQGIALDNAASRELLTLMADWRMDKDAYQMAIGSSLWPTLAQRTQNLISACHRYYDKGEFPNASLVRLDRMPSMVRGKIPGAKS